MPDKKRKTSDQQSGKLLSATDITGNQTCELNTQPTTTKPSSIANLSATWTAPPSTVNPQNASKTSQPSNSQMTKVQRKLARRKRRQKARNERRVLASITSTTLIAPPVKRWIQHDENNRVSSVAESKSIPQQQPSPIHKNAPTHLKGAPPACLKQQLANVIKATGSSHNPLTSAHAFPRLKKSLPVASNSESSSSSSSEDDLETAVKPRSVQQHAMHGTTLMARTKLKSSKSMTHNRQTPSSNAKRALSVPTHSTRRDAKATFAKFNSFLGADSDEESSDETSDEDHSKNVSPVDNQDEHDSGSESEAPNEKSFEPDEKDTQPEMEGDAALSDHAEQENSPADESSSNEKDGELAPDPMTETQEVIDSHLSTEPSEVDSNDTADTPPAPTTPSSRVDSSSETEIAIPVVSPPPSFVWPENIKTMSELALASGYNYGSGFFLTRHSGHVQLPGENGVIKNTLDVMDSIHNSVFNDTRPLPVGNVKQISMPKTRVYALERPSCATMEVSAGRSSTFTNMSQNPSATSNDTDIPRLAVTPSVDLYSGPLHEGELLPHGQIFGASLEAYHCSAPSSANKTNDSASSPRTLRSSRGQKYENMSSIKTDSMQTETRDDSTKQGHVESPILSSLTIEAEPNAIQVSPISTDPNPARKKRKMTGRTSKHFSPEKKPCIKPEPSEDDEEPSTTTSLLIPDSPSNTALLLNPHSTLPSPTQPQRRQTRKTGAKSNYFVPFYELTDRVDQPNPTRKPGRAPIGISTALMPSIHAPKFGIIQERLWDQPFWLLVAVMLLNKTTGRAAVPIFWGLKKRWPTPEILAEANQSEICDYIRCLGLQNRRSEKLIALAKQWIHDPPRKGYRWRTLHYPSPGDGKEYKPRTFIEGDGDSCEGGVEIGNLVGTHRYAWDSWRIFCRDVFRGVARGYNGEGADELRQAPTTPTTSETHETHETQPTSPTPLPFEPEWKRVLPTDKELRATLRWMWLRENQIWDPNTGDKRPMTDEEKIKAIEGGMEFEDDEGLEFGGSARTAAASAPAEVGFENEDGTLDDVEEVLPLAVGSGDEYGEDDTLIETKSHSRSVSGDGSQFKAHDESEEK
ncbi:Hypothetical protein R9X50_00647600 [Acrodontium crateriforme]|uniref:HhH-GPD domain-containing protein n=1 Tax=Acrodontium crateriforme TaxID=150365 RepID=A0AAQ3M8Y0_9PEZI|nr:Hypothetical protein R9X50_00647600 [Acrodontium crateriforme]